MEDFVEEKVAEVYKEVKPIFIAWTRSFWLTMGGIAMILEQGESLVRSFVQVFVDVALATGHVFDPEVIIGAIMSYGPALLWIMAIQQRAGAARPYTIDPRARE